MAQCDWTPVDGVEKRKKKERSKLGPRVLETFDLLKKGIENWTDGPRHGNCDL